MPVRAPGPTTDVSGRATIAVFPGDGIGPEVTAEAVAVLEAVAPRHGLVLELSPGTIGGAAIDAAGDPLPPAARRPRGRRHARLHRGGDRPPPPRRLRPRPPAPAEAHLGRQGEHPLLLAPLARDRARDPARVPRGRL